MKQLVMLRAETEWLLEYFEAVSTAVAENPSDGTLFTAFRPALDLLKGALLKVTLESPDLLTLVDLAAFFTRTPSLGKVSVELELNESIIWVSYLSFCIGQLA